MQTRWRIELFGGLRAVRGDTVVTHFRTQKAGLLLAYLALSCPADPHRQRPHPRDELADRFWPEQDPDAARAALRYTLTLLRRVLEPAEAPGAGAARQGSVLVADRATVRLNAAAVTTDVAEFEAALQSAARAGSGEERLQRLTGAVELCRGDFLAGYHDSWVLREREWLAERYFQALGALIAHMEEAGDVAQALAYARRGISADPLREDAHAALMRVYATAGQPAAALRQYRELERLLRQEMESTPSDATRTLARAIERGEFGARSSLPAVRTGDVSLARGRAPLPTASREPERRMVTLLAVAIRDASSSRRIATPSGKQSGQDGMRDRLSQAMIDAVLTYGGRVEVADEADVLAAFGVFEAHEDDAERAVHAALRMRDAALRLGLEIAAGIHTADVTVGAAAAASLAECEASSRAIGLQLSAGPGQILVDAATYHRVRRAFSFSSAPEAGDESTGAYVVERPLPRPDKPYGLEGRQTPLIGREEELARLQHALAETIAGQGRLVCLTGEAGVGKSRLVSELKGVAGCWFPDEALLVEGAQTPLNQQPTTNNQQRLTWLEGRCQEIGMTARFWPFLDILRHHLGWLPEEGEQERAGRLVAALHSLVDGGYLAVERIEEIGPLLGHLLSLRVGDEWEARLKNAGPEQIRHQSLVALRDLFTALARREPLVLVLEDLHWADAHSLDLILLLMEALARAPMLLLCIYRPEREHGSRRLGTVAAQKCPGQFTEIALRELTPAQSRRLVAALLQDERLPNALTDLVQTKARGNPLFVEEVVRSLIDARLLDRDQDTWRAAEGIEAAPLAPTVQSIIQSRVDRLGRDLKSLLQQAAVMGRLFRPRVLASLAREPEALDGALRELEEHSLIYQERVVPEAEYAFHHVLTREAIYEAIPPMRRAGLHQQVAEAMERLDAADLEAHSEALAYHYERSNAHEKAIEYLLKAGEKTRRAYLNEAAIGYFERTLARLGQTTANDGVPGTEHPEPSESRLKALTGLGKTYHRLGNMDEAESFLRQAAVLGKAIGLAPRPLVRLYYHLGEVFWWRSRFEDRVRIGEEGLALLGSDTECVETALMNDQIAWGSYFLEDRGRACEFTARNRPLLRSLPYTEELHAAYVHQVVVAAQFEKNLPAVREWCERLDRLGRAHGDWRAVADAHMHLGAHLCRYVGELILGVSHLQMAREHYAEIGSSMLEATALMWIGMGLLALGHLSEAGAASRQAATVLESVGHRQYARRAWRTLATVALCRGEWQHAAEANENDLRLEREQGRTGAYPTYLLGRVLLAQDKRTEAVERFCQSAVLLLGLPSEAHPILRREINLPLVLAAIEDTLYDPNERRRVLQELRAKVVVDGDAASFQWGLVAGEPDRKLCCVDSGLDGFRAEDIATESREPGWRWEDPLGDCSFQVSNGIEIQAANGRDLEYANLTAPRLVRTINGDFAAQAICLPASPNRPSIGGLLLWKDRENFLRLERGGAGPHEVRFHGAINGEDVFMGRGRLPCERTILRLERSGDQVRAFCSADGEHWFSIGQAEFPVTNPLEIGLHAIGWIDRTIYQGAYPEGTAIWFESFAMWAEDGAGGTTGSQ